MPHKQICIAMSGGVDSNVTAQILVQLGISCLGATMVLGIRDDEKNVSYAKAACEKLGIPHKVFDLRDAFAELVVQPFYEAYQQGLTPNPCINCNQMIKFGAMVTMAHELDCTAVASGHYARLDQQDGKLRLRRGIDTKKDQSYFLSRVHPTAFESVIFPLGSMTKEEVRARAHETGMPSAVRQESQDICFIDGVFADHLKEHLGIAHGNVMDKDGNVIGEHEGAHLYTMGQRKGLGVALGKPAYVCDKSAKRNEVVIGGREDVMMECVVLSNMNLFTALFPDPTHCMAQFRYNMKAVPCTVSIDGSSAIVRFDEPAFAPAPGQTCALYDGDTILGSGIIV